MPMNPRLLRPRQSFHQEAQDWATRVIANGGSYTQSTLSAMSTFCRSIDRETGLRAAILRLNLFCGNNLEACLVPLYRSATPSGTVLGNTTDTNNNFVSGDYAETGASGGLKGNGSTKYLSTGFGTNLLSNLSSSHLSISATSMETSIAVAGVLHIGTDSTGGNGVFDLGILNYSTANQRAMRLFAGSAYPYQGVSASTRGASESHMIATRTANNLATLYGAGSSLATDTGNRSPASTTNAIAVFATNANGTVSGHSAMRGRMYSIGNGLTAAQALAFSNAVAAFNTALGR